MLDRDRLADALQNGWNECFSLPAIDIYGDEGSIIISAILADITAQGFVIVPRVATPAMVANALPIEDEPTESEMEVGREAVRLLSGGDNGPEQDVLAGQMARDWALMIATSQAQGD